MDRVEYDTEILKVVLDEMAHEAGVRVLLHSQLAQVEPPRPGHRRRRRC